MQYKAVIFDFDGTICDTGEGIKKSAKFALEAFGYEAPENEELNCFIGPPLLVTFQEKFGADPVEAAELVKKFRERYTNKGVFESCLYDGIKELLFSLKKDGIKMGIASSKPQDYIETLLEHFGIKQYFDVICGVSFTADCESKANIISRCARELEFSGNEMFVVGDKKYDIDGAKANMIDSVGVLWGYGSKFEHIEAGAKFIIDKPFDIESIALGFYEQTEDVQGIFSGRIISVHNDTVMMVDGTTAEREVVDHPGGVGIVGLTENNEILLVRQFRYPYKETIYEIPAGKLEKGEDPKEAGLREFSEECGATAQTFESLGEIYPTPGYCSEIIRLYYATGLTFGEQNLDCDEFLDVTKMPINECVTRIMNGEIKDAKTICAVFKIKELLKI
ncbi:MAG: HAD hydrolase-like protein [Clostridiales bacterium]|nr:HAD hydrolase-like protein [Clostridiales bacterium]